MNNWKLTQKGYGPEMHNHFAPVYTVGNGLFCCRGFMEEQHEGIAGLGGIYMAGVFGRASYTPWKGEGQELVNLPNFFWVDISINGESMRLTAAALQEYTETLDIHNAVFTRRYRYTLDGKSLADFAFERFASHADIRLAGQKITITPLMENLDIRVALGFNADVSNLNAVSSEPYPVQPGRKHFDVVSRSAETLCIKVRNDSETLLAFAQRITAQDAAVLANDDLLTVNIQKPAGETVTIQKLVSVAEPYKHADPLAAVRALLSSAPDVSAIYEKHLEAMKQFWEIADVRICGDDEAQIALRYNILQLQQSCPQHTDTLSIGARGLTGEMYEGSVFWDTEIFMLPFFNLTNPAAAKNLLSFRYRTLGEAKAHAESNWFKGAMYGWQVNAEGVEQTPRGVGAYYSVHVIADIAFAILEYWNSTGDDDFLLRQGLEILLETARFWASRVTKRTDGFYDIIAVRGPNEYDVLVNNNLYTNLMARENFLLCERISKLFAEKYPVEWTALSARLGFADTECEKWLTIADKIVLPYEKEQDLWLEDDAWLRRKPLDMAKAKPTAKRIIDTTIPYEALPFYQVTKQADVLHAMKNLPWRFTQEQVDIAFDYYRPKTAFDSSLAYSMFALMAARLGRAEDALGFFDSCINLDIRNVQLNTISGLHFANFGGSWQAAVFGFGGVSVLENALEVAPNLPARFEKLSFHLRYRGALLTVVASHTGVSVSMVETGSAPVQLIVRGQNFTLINSSDFAEVNV